jgi:hypothetical protein
MPYLCARFCWPFQVAKREEEKEEAGSQSSMCCQIDENIFLFGIKFYLRLQTHSIHTHHRKRNLNKTNP